MESSANSAKKRQRKIVKKWTSAEIIVLISLVEERPALWDHNTQIYRNRDLKNSNWEEIGQATGRDIEDCKAEWGNVRSRYTAERRKEMSTKSGQSGERYSSRYEFFGALSFLSSVCERQPGSTQTNMQIVEVELLDSPINIEYLENYDQNNVGSKGVTPKRAKVVPTTTPDRTDILNKISNYLGTRSQPPSWKRVFGEHVVCELDRYSNEDAHRLKVQLNAVLDNFQPKDNNATA